MTASHIRIDLCLNESQQQTLQRFMRELNAMSPISGDRWNEQRAIEALLLTALHRERDLQIANERRTAAMIRLTNAPEWLEKQ